MIRIQNSSEYRIAIDKMAFYRSDEANTRRQMEECGELTRAANKMLRSVKGEDDEKIDPETARKNLVEEMADVMICADVLRSIYSISDTEMDSAIIEKVMLDLNRMKIPERKAEDDQIMKAFAAARECCGGCVD